MGIVKGVAVTAAASALLGVGSSTTGHEPGTHERLAATSSACARAHLPHADELVIVFATGLRKDGTPGAAFSRRLDTAATELSRNPHSEVLVVGRQKDGTAKEGRAGVRRLVQVDHVAPKRTMQANKSPNTVTNVEEALPNVECVGPAQVKLDSERYHVPRVHALFEQAERANGLHYVVKDLPAPDLLSPRAAHQKQVEERHNLRIGRAEMARDYLFHKPSTVPDAIVGDGD